MNKIENIILEPNNNNPIYITVADQFDQMISSGMYKANERLPALRKLAEHLGVALDTVKKAYQELEHRNLVYSRVGSGTYVNENQQSLINGSSLQAITEQQEYPSSIDLSLNEQVLLAERGSELSQALARLSQHTNQLQYMATYQATEKLIQPQTEIIADFMSGIGIPTQASELLLTSGAQQAIHLVLQYLVNGEQCIAASNLAYPGARQAAQQLNRQLISIPHDDEGMDTAVLEQLLKQHDIRCVYITPEYDNPTTTVMSQARREHLASLAKEHDLLIIEDCALYMPPNGLPSLYSLAPERTIYLFSFSKILAGGLRLGAVKVTGRLQRKLAIAQQSQFWMVSPFLTSITCELIASGAAQRLLDQQTRELEARHQLASEILHGYEVSGRAPGYHIWLALPDHIDVNALLTNLRSRHVVVAPGQAFSIAEGKCPVQGLRISLACTVTQQNFIKALETLRECIDYPSEGSDWNII